MNYARELWTSSSRYSIKLYILTSYFLFFTMWYSLCGESNHYEVTIASNLHLIVLLLKWLVLMSVCQSACCKIVWCNMHDIMWYDIIWRVLTRLVHRLLCRRMEQRPVSLDWSGCLSVVSLYYCIPLPLPLPLSLLIQVVGDIRITWCNRYHVIARLFTWIAENIVFNVIHSSSPLTSI